MRMTRVLVICSMLTMYTAAVIASPRQQAAPAAVPAVPGLTMTSTGFEDGGIIPPKFTQSVPNFVSPELKWNNVPSGVVSFVLIFHDAEGALNKTTEDILHWLAFNIPGTVRELPEAVPADPRLPDGTIQAKNRRGNVGFLGPGMGPAGPYHHYTFELFALDNKLDLGPDATRPDVLKAMEGHIIVKAVLVGRFHRLS